MTSDFGREELQRLLRRIEEIPPPPPTMPDVDRLDADARSSGGPTKLLIADRGAALQPLGPGSELEVAGTSRRLSLSRMALIGVVTGALATVAALRIIPTRDDAAPAKSQVLLAALPEPHRGDPERASPQPAAPSQPPRLLLDMVENKIALQRGQAWPLGVRATAEGDGVTLVVKGLAAGATLSAGRSSEANAWRLDGGDLHDVVLVPPDGFVGTMDLTIELLHNGATADRQGVQLEWLGPKIAPPQAAALSPGDATRLLQRGEELLARGEIVAARAVFERLADRGEARGALALARTYEQSTLDRLGARGLVADVATARRWYEKARELGSNEAQRALDLSEARKR